MKAAEMALRNGCRPASAEAMKKNENENVKIKFSKLCLRKCGEEKSMKWILESLWKSYKINESWCGAEMASLALEMTQHTAKRNEMAYERNDKYSISK